MTIDKKEITYKEKTLYFVYLYKYPLPVRYLNSVYISYNSTTVK